MPIQFLSTQSIEGAAHSFLLQYHGSLTPPVPIDEIVEQQLRMEIIPLHGLRLTADTSGWISSSLTTICVDMDEMMECEPRYRFTLAHEVAHVFLHSEFYSQHTFETTEQWKAFTSSISESDLGKLEFQANEFAGRILIPTGPLTTMLRESKHKIRKIVGTEAKLAQEIVAHYAAVDLHERFNVSQKCMEIRILRQFCSSPNANGLDRL